MKLTPLRVILVALLGVIAVSLFGGTAMWRVLGFGDDLGMMGAQRSCAQRHQSLDRVGKPMAVIREAIATQLRMM